MGSDAEGVIGIYQRHAGVWSRDRGEILVEKAWLDRFLAAIPQPASVLDIGCGGGAPIAQYLVGRDCRVTGVDASSAMIGLCADRFPEHEWHVGDMRALVLDREFQGIIVWDSLFHLPPADQRRMFPVFAHHSAPGGALMFTSGPSAGERIGTYRGERLYHASLDSAEYHALLHDNGFEVVAHIAEDPGCGLRTVWLARRDRG
ncbi:class I SAM-dependent methyltransferase [Mycobacterium sp. 1081908.1]|uniref:class I SAM-dependent methyltransferase n=1 Tax=Mycobacterium sp. 1081908.1 TaxID=1834066 RepID=UPI000800252B|nr:class I SAM-dependent methyltransferase [Mycobacterium sp. 1081908.1]OBK51420.1 methyltransferase [Mycobacterium sp. 1081908.1]